VQEGQVWANSQQLQFAIEALTEGASSAIVDAKGAHLLTKRELSVVPLVAEGLSIATSLTSSATASTR
jgi:hypothetical protein